MLVSFMRNSRIKKTLVKTAVQKSFGMSLVTDFNNTARHTVSSVSQGGVAATSGVKVGDVLVAINGQHVHTLDHAGVLDILKRVTSAELELGRGRDWCPPQNLKDIPAFFVRTVDAFKVGAKLDEYDDDLIPTYFNQAMASDLLGGPLVPDDNVPTVPAADFVVKSGLRADSAEDEFLFFSSDQTDTSAFGYRYQLASCMNIYDSTQVEVKQLQWTGTSFFAHEQGDVNVGSEEAVAPLSKKPTSTNLNGDIQGTLFRQKSIEASNANRRIRELEAQLEILRNSTVA